MKKITISILFVAFSLLATCSCSGSKEDNSAFVAEDSMPGGGKYDPTQKPEPQEPVDPIQDGNWDIYKVDETGDLTYYCFNAFDSLSNAYQFVNVLSVNLNSTRYSVKFSYTNGSTTSAIYKANNAVGCLNATYEKASVFIKVNGVVQQSISSDVIPGTLVPQWKSEAAIYSDGEQDVKIQFTAKGLDLEATRAVYAASTKKNIFTSAPMLVDNFDPIGETFINRCPGYRDGMDIYSLDYENPILHQGQRHPRSAVALTEDNHFLMIAVDGRRARVSEGMTCRELTRFLVKYFNPQYALNLDGGGSTALCVKGFGDPNTNVVNYPTDNNQYDHAGERSVPTHFYVVDNGVK